LVVGLAEILLIGPAHHHLRQRLYRHALAPGFRDDQIFQNLATERGKNVARGIKPRPVDRDVDGYARPLPMETFCFERTDLAPRIPMACLGGEAT
jgi:hypothetical protein